VKTREERLAEIFIGLADTLVSDFDVTDLFYHLVDARWQRLTMPVSCSPTRAK
jgi:hypothetical protein